MDTQHRWQGTATAFMMVVLIVTAITSPTPQTAHGANPAADPPPTNVTIPGTLQSKLGCAGDWQPTCSKTFLGYDPVADVWVGTFDLPAGTFEYKVAINQSWSENYGGKADRDGPNVVLALEKPAKVTFVYDHKTHVLVNSAGGVVPVVVGDMQSELGCAKDDDPTCLAGLMLDPEFDGSYAFVTTKLPRGAYTARVAFVGGASDSKTSAFTVDSDKAEVQFSYDAAAKTLEVSTDGAPKGNINKARAHWVKRDTVLWAVPNAPGYSYRLHSAAEGGLRLSGKGVSGGTTVTLTVATDDSVFAAFPHLKGYTVLKLDEASAARAAELLKGQLAVSAFDASGKLLDTSGVQIGGALDDVFAGAARKAQLGVVFAKGKPSLAVWAPTARNVSVLLFDDATTSKSTTVPMKVDATSGVWSVAGEATWKNKYYLFEVEVYVPTTGKVEKNRVTDPYSISLSMNSTRSQIVDMNDAALMPKGWANTQKPPLAAPEDAVIYELHVRDFSMRDTTVPQNLRGTFAAFMQADSAGMKHLKALAEAGLTHIHLLPVFDIASIDEDKTQRKEADFAALSKLPPDSDQQQATVGQSLNSDGFNWGYDPYHFNAPEGSYATEPNGPTRILEFRQMVQALNNAGLRVVMDVVYNHTTAAGQTDKSVFDKIVPGYYYRLNKDGGIETSTCCQNTASERAMMEKFMVDSVTMWATAYKVDGFRFDLMGHHMLSNMQAVRGALDALTSAKNGVDGKSIILYGEGWDFGEVANNARGVNATQLNLAGSGIGSFNDRMRDAARGGNPFDDRRIQGFITGLGTAPNAVKGIGTDNERTVRIKLLDATRLIELGLAGSLSTYLLPVEGGRTIRGNALNYNGKPAGYTLDPQEAVNYVSAHDNETLFDKIQWAAPVSTTMAERVRMNNLGLSLVMLGQGVPFFHAGDDLLRSKSLDRDSYNSGDWFNAIDFSGQSNNWGLGLPPAGPNQDRWSLMKPLLADPALRATPDDIAHARDYFRDLLQIRKSSPLFRLQTGQQVIDRVHFLNTGDDAILGLIVMDLRDDGAQQVDGKYARIVVLFNANPRPVTFADGSFAGAKFVLHPVQISGSDAITKQATFDSPSNAFTVPGRTTAVFVVSR